MEDYTTAFLVVAGVLCFLALFIIWATWGYPIALLTAFFANRAMPRGR